VYRFQTHAEANRHQEECTIAAIVQIARERAR
jgi:hypothetical protein